MKRGSILRMELYHMVSRPEFKISLTAVLTVVAVSFWQLCDSVRGLNENRIYSAAYGWIGHANLLQLPAMQMFYLVFIFFIGSLAFSDSHFIDRKKKIRSLIVTRCARNRYIFAGALTSFFGAFFVLFVPLFLSQLLGFLIFPTDGSVFGNSPFSRTSVSEIPKMIGFPALYYGEPFLYNFLQMLYIAAFAGAVAFFSFSLSFFVRRGRLLVIGIPAVLILIESALAPLGLSIPYYLDMGFYRLPLAGYWLFPLVVLLAGGILLSLQLHVTRDELS